MKNTVIVITGPTASGKSGIGIELAKKLNGVVVSADSMQIYKKLDVGTAKVTETEADGIKHELIDIIDYDKNFSVSDYKDLCYYKLDEILEQGKTPIIVGGTGLYINAVVNNMEFNKFDEALENEVNVKLEGLTNGKTPDEIYDLLYSMDKEAALKIGKGNGKRLIRAIKLNMLGVEKSSIDEKNDLWHKNPSKYNFLTVFLDMPRTLPLPEVIMLITFGIIGTMAFTNVGESPNLPATLLLNSLPAKAVTGLLAASCPPVKSEVNCSNPPSLAAVCLKLSKMESESPPNTLSFNPSGIDTLPANASPAFSLMRSVKNDMFLIMN